MMRNIQRRQTERDAASVERYLEAIGQEERLSNDEMLVLTRRIRSGDDSALDRLVKANLQFVVSIARQYQGLGLDLFDLINEGNMGLLKAARRFDPERGVQFLSYAVWWVRQTIGEAVTAAQRQNELSGISLGQQRSDGHTTMLDYIEDEASPQADAALSAESRRSGIQQAMDGLMPREREVISRTFGLDREAQTMAEAGREMGLTRSRVRQIRKGALRKLRRACAF